MKKIILSLAIAAFLSAGSLAFASTTSSTDQNSETIQLMQDGKKKASSTKKADAKGEKATECKDSKSASKSDCKSACKGDDKVAKKSCCSDGKASSEKKSNPEKK